MENSRKKIINKLNEGSHKAAMQAAFTNRLRDAEDVVKSSLGSDTPPDDVKDIAARLATEGVDNGFDIQKRVFDIVNILTNNGIEVNVENIIIGSLFSVGGTLSGHENEVNSIINNQINNLGENKEVLNKFIKQYGKEKGKQIYYATANKQDRNPETFKNEGEHDSVGRGIEAGMNPEVEADKYEEYRQLMQQLASEEDEQPVKEVSVEPTTKPTNDPVKLKTDVAKLIEKLDMSSIAPYLDKIDNPTEQAEIIAQFAEKIGVPKGKLASVISQLKTVAENTKMTKDELIESVTGRKIIKTIKVKDIK